MSFNSFIPAVWSGELQKNLNNDHVYAKLFNRKYEGEIKGYGSSVKINMLGRITTFAYTRNTDITAAEELDLASQTLVIDQARAFNFAIDDVDAAQARSSVRSEAMQEASWALSEDLDDYLAGTVLVNGVALSVTAATVGTGAGEQSAYDTLVAMDVALNETNTPRGNRKIVVPPWYEGMLRLDERFVSFGTDGNKDALRGAPIGRAAGFEVLMSNNVPLSGSAYRIFAGYTGAGTMAEQIDQMKAYEDPDRFNDAVKGLHVYGAKVTRPSNYVQFVATRGSFV